MDTSNNTPCDDAIVEANVALLRERSRVGVDKYGVTLAGAGLTPAQLRRHALEEALDLANYLQAHDSEVERLQIELGAYMVLLADVLDLIPHGGIPPEVTTRVIALYGTHP